MAKRKKKAKPRRRRTVVQPQTQCDQKDDIQQIKEKKFAFLYNGLSTKKDILERVETELIAPIYDNEKITADQATTLANWWFRYADRILENDHETVETVQIKIRTGALFEALVEQFRPAKAQQTVSEVMWEIYRGYGTAQKPTPPPSEPPPC